MHSQFQVDVEEGRSFQYATDDVFGRVLFWKGMRDWHEAPQLRLFCRLAARSRRFVDVGANTGLYSLLACMMNSECQVTAFEPVPRVHRHLSDNIGINGWPDRCTIYQEAVSDFIGTARFHIPSTEVPTSASLHQDGFRGYEGDCIEIPVTTIDERCNYNERIGLMKIDVEGFEDRVLRGMTRVLTQDKPDLVIECLPDGPCKEVETILAAAGYRFFHLRESGPLLMDHIVPDPNEKHRDYLCSADLDIDGIFS